MDPLGNLLTPRPIQTGWEFTIEPYPGGRFGYIDDLDSRFGNGSVCTRTRTQSDGPEMLLTLPMTIEVLKLCEVASQDCAHVVCQFHPMLRFTLHFQFPQHRNIAFTFWQKLPYTMTLNLFSIVKIFQWQRILEYHQEICLRCLPVQRFIIPPNHTVLPPDIQLPLLLEIPQHPSSFQLLDHTAVGLPYHSVISCQGDIDWLAGDWNCPFNATQVWAIITLIICIIIISVVWNIWQLVQVHDHCNHCFLQFCWWLASFYWEANGGSARCTRSRPRWRKVERWSPYDTTAFGRSCRWSQCSMAWHPMSCMLPKWYHSSPTITDYVVVISLPLWPIPWTSLAGTGDLLQTWCQVKWRIVTKLESAGR